MLAAPRPTRIISTMGPIDHEPGAHISRRPFDHENADVSRVTCVLAGVLSVYSERCAVLAQFP